MGDANLIDKGWPDNTAFNVLRYLLRTDGDAPAKREVPQEGLRKLEQQVLRKAFPDRVGLTTDDLQRRLRRDDLDPAENLVLSDILRRAYTGEPEEMAALAGRANQANPVEG
ncbi:MAG: hypothetical protein ACT4TC_06795 [Myxococcaceae bacterium]